MFSILEVCCLRRIAKQIYNKLKSSQPNICCCNAYNLIEQSIELFVREDEKGKHSLFRKARSDYCMAIKLIIFLEFLNRSPVFHECQVVRTLDRSIEHAKNFSLKILIGFLMKEKQREDIRRHVAAIDTVYLHGSENLRRYHLTNSNLNEIHQICYRENMLLIGLIPISLEAIYYAIHVNKIQD